MKIAVLSILCSLLLAASSVALGAAPSLPAGMTALPLAAITNDRDASVSNIALMLDQHKAVRGIYIKTTHRNSLPTSGQAYWLADIESKDGVVLGQGQGHKAILLQGDIASRDGRGSLVIRYLHNGLFHSYDQCRVGLQRLSPGHWQMVNAYSGDAISHIQVETWALGISTLANVCPADA